MQGVVWLCVLAILSVGLHFQELAPGWYAGLGVRVRLTLGIVVCVCVYFCVYYR